MENIIQIKNLFLENSYNLLHYNFLIWIFKLKSVTKRGNDVKRTKNN